MDAATCGPCREFDGREYRTWEAAMVDLPGGGPNPLCLGDGRCRCRVVPCPPGDVEREPGRPPEEEPPTDLDDLQADPRYEDEVVSAWEACYQAEAERAGISIGVLWNRLRAALRARTSRYEPRIRANPGAALAIINDGRFRSQFETGTSGGLLNPGVRSDAEQKMFGYPPDFPADQRPIYGYLSDADQSGASAWVRMYGQIVFRLKTDVRRRTTVTFEDSLGMGMIPSPLDDPDPYSLGCDPDVRQDILDRVDQPTPLGAYTEIQIHGGVSLDDVEEVVIEDITGGVYGETWPQLMAALRSRGIPHRVVTSIIGAG